MKKKVLLGMSLLIYMLSFAVTYASGAEAVDHIALNESERTWLDQHRDQPLILGLDPYAGMEYFEYDGNEYGFALNLEKVLEKDLGIAIELETQKSWGEVYEGLKTGEVDILLGANETPERLEFMAFTQPLYRIPYAILAERSGDIHTLGDIDNQKVGFIQGDIVMELFPEAYKNIDYKPVFFESQNEALEALHLGEIEAVISSGGAVVFDYIDQYSDIKLITEIKQITSDMTLSTLIENKIVADILDKEILHLKASNLDAMIQKAKIEYNYKVMKLTSDEINWIRDEGHAVAGVPGDYLPIDYYEDGQYKGMAGAVLQAVGEMTGVTFEGVAGEFSDLMQQVAMGKIQILDMAKTEDREKEYFFTDSFSDQRDIIIGRKEDEYVGDIYGLEGRKVAVVEGYWHDEHLRKNLLDPQIIYTQSIEESLKAVANYDADYMIENPSVAQFYIDEYELYNLTLRGNTSMDSYFYFGISKKSPELVSIINKSLRFIDLEKVMRDGIAEVPHTSQKASIMRWIFISAGLVIVLAILGMVLVRVTRALIESKATTEALKAKEKYIYEDAMTKLYNRHYLYFKVEPHIQNWTYPQTAVLCDLNNLKAINDCYGHAMGDRLLKTFAKLLQDVFPDKSIITRTGGDEFLILLLGQTDEAVKQYTKALEGQCRGINISDDGNRINPSAAIGVATRNNHHKTFEELIKEADDRMYAHKREIKKISK